ncbi:MAG: baseplate J/gp47 family protein [Planctomycetes bacterium]|nr:baseplate J/gp47 family protein [Planctomycetota bacterium]
MASLPTYTFGQIVTNIATATQAACSALVDFTVGSVLRAIAQATASVVLWLQAIILQVLTLTRAATSAESDLDSWMADYGFTRLAAVAASGGVTFSRFTATQQALIPVGATVQTSDGTQNFAVIADTANSAYNATLGGYVIPANTASVTIPVQATVAGAGGNVQSGTVTVITSPIPGVDTATNASAFANGIDAESDAAMRVRFVAYLASLSKATKTAVGYAVTSVQQGLNYTLTENLNYNGTANNGYFYVVVDDGTGSPPAGLLADVGSAIDAVRPLTSTFGVFAPQTTAANIAMTLTSASGYNHASVVAAVTTALTSFIGGLTIGQSLPYTQIAGIVYDVPGVTNATGILLNSGTADLTADAKHKLISGTMTIA